MRLVFPHFVDISDILSVCTDKFLGLTVRRQRWLMLWTTTTDPSYQRSYDRDAHRTDTMTGRCLVFQKQMQSYFMRSYRRDTFFAACKSAPLQKRLSPQPTTMGRIFALYMDGIWQDEWYPEVNALCRASPVYLQKYESHFIIPSSVLCKAWGKIRETQ